MPGYGSTSSLGMLGQQKALEKQQHEAKKAQQKQDLMGYLNLIPILGGLTSSIYGLASGSAGAGAGADADAAAAASPPGTGTGIGTGAAGAPSPTPPSANTGGAGLSIGAAMGGGPGGGLKPEYTGGSLPGAAQVSPRTMGQAPPPLTGIPSSNITSQIEQMKNRDLYLRLAGQYQRGY